MQNWDTAEFKGLTPNPFSSTQKQKPRKQQEGKEVKLPKMASVLQKHSKDVRRSEKVVIVLIRNKIE